MKTYSKAIPGNRYSVMTDCGTVNYFQLWDNTLQKMIADSSSDDELILYAQKNNMVNGQIVVIS